VTTRRKRQEAAKALAAARKRARGIARFGIATKNDRL